MTPVPPIPAATWPDPASPGVPLNPERDGWHWIGDVPMLWRASDQTWNTVDYLLNQAWVAEQSYFGPVLTPAEAQALRTRAETAETSDAETCRMFNANQVETAERGLRIEALMAERDGLAAEVAALRARPDDALVERAIQAAMASLPQGAGGDRFDDYLYHFVGERHWEDGGKEEIEAFLREPIRAALSATPAPKLPPGIYHYGDALARERTALERAREACREVLRHAEQANEPAAGDAAGVCAALITAMLDALASRGGA